MMVSIVFQYLMFCWLIQENNKKVIVSVIQRSSSQSIDEFDSVLSNFENFLNGINKRKQSLSVVTDDLPLGGLKKPILLKD